MPDDSGFIYLVRTGSLLNQEAIPLVAFTDAAELRAWLLPGIKNVPGLKVFRLRDGVPGAVEMDVNKILEA